MKGRQPKLTGRPLGTKSYNLNMPISMWKDLVVLSRKINAPVVELLKKAIKLLLLIHKPGAKLWIQEEGKAAKEIIIL